LTVELKVNAVTLGKDLVEEAEKLQTELDGIDDDGSADSEERINQIQSRLEQIEEAQTEFTPLETISRSTRFQRKSLRDFDQRPTTDKGRQLERPLCFCFAKGRLKLHR
jgi:DNA-binding protein H-NS